MSTSASAVPALLPDATRKLVSEANVFVVGAGGIGCEVLKNLALSGFKNIEIIDLDTIDVSNLNRQFLFRKEHVGKSKAMVARESILAFNPDINISAYHDSIISHQYGLSFFKKFDVVLNALDNRAARSHVNRMCLAADVPLIESGTSGYSGQAEFIKKGLTQCYDCRPKEKQKTFPGCTIRNTPSEPVHCIVWAKHLFNQLFGEEDKDQDVSPDTADPELAGDAGQMALAAKTGDVERTSTRDWAVENDYNGEKLFNKFFQDDIKYLLAMANLWKERTPPVPLSWSDAVKTTDEPAENASQVNRPDMQVWSLSKCAEVFESSISDLKVLLKGKNALVWDKDDKPAMDFVTACANIRSQIFHIERKSRFDTKSIAGNIIPAIASTNAMVAGLVVLMAMRVLAKDYDNCQTVYARAKSSVSNTVLMAERQFEPPNPRCMVCADRPTVSVYVDTQTMTVKEFETEVLKKTFNMVAPDVMNATLGSVVISSEEGETECNNDKKLCDAGIADGCELRVDDFLQDYELTVHVFQYAPKAKDDPPFKYTTDVELKAKESTESNGVGTNGSSASGAGEKTDGDGDGDDDDVTVMDSGAADLQKAEEEEDDDPQEGSSKRRKLNPPEEDDDDLMLIEDDD